MPEGLADSLTRAELVDLVRFLSELGKVGPFAVGQSRLVRRWQTLEPTREAQELVQRIGPAAVVTEGHSLAWSPAYSTVSGILPPDAMGQLGEGTKAIAFVRCQLEGLTPGKARLKLNSPAGLSLWLDRISLEAKEEVLLDLAQGVHTLTFAVNLAQRTEGLRCELDDVPGSAARVQPVGGK